MTFQHPMVVMELNHIVHGVVRTCPLECIFPCIRFWHFEMHRTSCHKKLNSFLHLPVCICGVDLIYRVFDVCPEFLVLFVSLNFSSIWDFAVTFQFSISFSCFYWKFLDIAFYLFIIFICHFFHYFQVEESFPFDEFFSFHMFQRLHFI